jgi:DNA-binding transcriptional MerR regulator
MGPVWEGRCHVHVARIRRSAALGHELGWLEVDAFCHAANISSLACHIWISRLIWSEAAAVYFQLEPTCKGHYPTDMETTYTIGQLARVSGVKTSTIRYYERIGILHPEGRTASNYRLYDEEALQRLRFIRASQATGFTIEDITNLLRLRDGTSGLCEDVQVLIEERLSDLDRRLADLWHMQRVLKATLEKCRATQWSGRCQIIDTLTATSARQP